MIPHVNKFNNNLLRRFIISCDRAEKNLNIETAEENLRFVESLMSKLNDDLFIMMEAISPKTFKQFRYNIITLFQENSMMNLTYNHANPDQNLSTLEYVKSLSLLKAECQFYREFGLEGKISNLEMDKILRYRISMERQCYGDADNVIACMKTVDKLDFSSYMG